VVLYNLFTTPKIKRILVPLEVNPKVSVLIPARNEESNIEECLRLIINQDYTNFEIIVLNDESTDSTEEKVKIFVKNNSQCKLIQGKPLLTGWTGKNWACHQLSENASGELLLFIDADVLLEKWAIRSSVQLLHINKLKFLSCFPTQKIKSFGEWLVVPLMNWLLLSFLPLKKVFTSKFNSLVAANGQFILFDKYTYFKLGGHEKAKDKVVEDMELARTFKRNGNKIMTALGNDSVKCRMYDGYSSAYTGFSKNFFAGFNISSFSFLILLFFLLFIFLLPLILVFLKIIYIWIIFLIMVIRIFLSISSKQNLILNVLLHPFQMIIMFIVGLNSIYVNKKNKIIWKSRKL
jgi:chlorobactene glucosyltransferase